jgi:hypothetical protein
LNDGEVIKKGDRYWDAETYGWKTEYNELHGDIVCSGALYSREIPSVASDDIATLVQADIEARAVLGVKKYGTRLRPNNGRHALVDAYQEALDLCMYLRQALAEQGIESPGTATLPDPEVMP